jgi:hypothetical protein
VIHWSEKRPLDGAYSFRWRTVYWWDHPSVRPPELVSRQRLALYLSTAEMGKYFLFDGSLVADQDGRSLASETGSCRVDAPAEVLAAFIGGVPVWEVLDRLLEVCGSEHPWLARAVPVVRDAVFVAET